MRRRLLTFGLIAAIQVAGLAAPLVHVHLDDHHADHHGPNRMHSHLDGHVAAHRHDGGAPAVHAEDATPERVAAVPVFVAAESDGYVDSAITESSIGVFHAADSRLRRPLEDVRSHGPPVVRSLPPRAPPAAFLI